ncbi:MAG: phage terminase small subunit [Candidatus Sedimenticola sp. (ex Thyasira tokunagai)]
MTPAKRHFQKATAAANSAAVADPETTADRSQYELMLLQLAQHKRQLKGIQSVEQKIELKKQLLPEYLPYIEGVLESDASVQDDVLMTLVVWAIDVGDITLALRMGNYALAHGMTPPDQYSRDTATLLTEEAAEYAIANPGLVSAETIDDLEQLATGRDMPDEVRAKLYKAIGLNLQESSVPAAIGAFKRALELNPRVGVKKLKEKLERELKNAQAQAAKEAAALADNQEPSTAATE